MAPFTFVGMPNIVSSKILLRLPCMSGFNTSISCASYSSSAQIKNVEGEMEFRVFDFKMGKEADSGRSAGRRKERLRRVPVPPYRTLKMPVDQDWSSAWPTARVFHPASVPLPLHQGWVEPKSVPPGKFINAELMKVLNFLHLTPPAIQRHCEALKKFCTKWPEGLSTEEQIELHFPIRYTHYNHCHSSPSIRDDRSRVVQLQLKLDSLPLDEHSRDKLLRLVKDRYNPKTGLLTITADRCPLRKQNMDYAIYLLSVVVNESWKMETWENDKSEQDMEKYIWNGSQSQRSLKELAERSSGKVAAMETDDGVRRYAEAVTQLHNKDEDSQLVTDYKEAVKALLLKK